MDILSPHMRYFCLGRHCGVVGNEAYSHFNRPR